WYTEPAFHAFDEAQVIATAWQYAGHTSHLAEPSSYLTLPVAGEPVVVVRTKEGDLRAFYNVCRHRGGPLATAACGHLRKGVLQCQYHGWTYRLDGMLRGVLRFDRTELFDKRDYGLVPVAVQTWEGLVFVHLDDDPPSLAAQMNGIRERIAPLDLTTVQFHQRVVYDVACNWKVYVDNFLEGYHIPLVHPELATLLDVRAYETETYPHYSLQHSPLRGEGALYGADDSAAFYYFVFPNTVLNILPGRLQVNRVIPVAADCCQVVFDYAYTDATSPEAQEIIAVDLDLSDRVQAEDAAICAHVQRGLTSRAYDRGRFSVEAEVGVYHFQCLLKEAYRRALETA
ncbi:MAG: aromatic ring-hydroxylating dioxygenase subunit alpha, partial [Rhodothermaceae bacterium]|nr:aromatic ring-hydroxylating dioxygenase subunit alpha [Rhodothermaceae bacterium]